ncbi:MAG TPA: DUF302 domain-containing protein [Parvibaculum sp.]|uniref:DUF302 domain-containing protein n=1 Tax=Parvibaculum sp. TaxID=2024848 RepID=UPI002C7F2D3A|nr:DUF302 domain-containing protein [Parvibaculum sp.]HMM14627.1 DUF302 domain-containing protein [Parvibaculum sp.]
MTYYHARTLETSFDDAVARITSALAKQGFGVLTDIDIAATMKKKLGLDMSPYRILGACNPEMAAKALEVENKIGTMLPCNVIVRESGPRWVEIAAINPLASMSAVGNPKLDQVATKVDALLRAAVDSA